MRSGGTGAEHIQPGDTVSEQRALAQGPCVLRTAWRQGHYPGPVHSIVRTFAPFVAGIALMSPVKFLSFNITGAILWVVGLVSAGYFLGNIPIVKNNFSVVIYGIIIVSVLPVVIEFIRAKIKK